MGVEEVRGGGGGEGEGGVEDGGERPGVHGGIQNLVGMGGALVIDPCLYMYIERNTWFYLIGRERAAVPVAALLRLVQLLPQPRLAQRREAAGRRRRRWVRAAWRAFVVMACAREKQHGTRL